MTQCRLFRMTPHPSNPGPLSSLKEALDLRVLLEDLLAQLDRVDLLLQEQLVLRARVRRGLQDLQVLERILDRLDQQDEPAPLDR